MVRPDVLPWLVAAAVLVLVLAAEALHAARVRRVAQLAFGPDVRPAPWARLLPLWRGAAAAALAWGLATLLVLPPGKHAAEDGASASGDKRHVLLVLDVSPSMRLVDAGPDGNQSRMHRARDLMESFFARVPLSGYRLSVVAVYNGAKPVVVDTSDMDVVRNVLGDLPMHYAFPSGDTKLLDGIEEASAVARPWNPKSTVLVLLSDGDTVPATGMPKLPASVDDVLVVGVGDPRAGTFIDGRQSRQDASTLRQIATRLGGVYHDGNLKHLPTSMLSDLFASGGASPFERLTLREYALAAAALGAALLALLPLLLHAFGTTWRPGRPPAGRARAASEAPRRRARAAALDGARARATIGNLR